MTVHQAVRALRRHHDQTQQIFATQLGISISSLTNYERDRVPEPKQLLAFQKAAAKIQRNDLERVFQAAFEASLGLTKEQGVFTTADLFETLAVTVLLHCLRTNDRYTGRTAADLTWAIH